MTTRTKLIVAGAILAALVGLVALDVVTSKKRQSDRVTVVTPSREDGGGRRSPRGLLPAPGSGHTNPIPVIPYTTPTPTRPDTGPSETAQAGTSSTPAPSTHSVTPIPTTPTPVEPARSHTIQPGERLWDIAEAYYGDGRLWTLVQEANPTIRPTALRPGQTLTIPPKPSRGGATVGTGEAIQQTTDGRYYVVQSGDTLERIAIRVYGSSSYAPALYEANRREIPRPEALAAGMRVRLPEIAASRPVTPSSPATPSSGSGRVYAVQSGDSLWKIAQREGVAARDVQGYIEAIVRANPDRLRTVDTPLLVGWQLQLPPR